jgi:hypothetical protein
VNDYNNSPFSLSFWIKAKNKTKSKTKKTIWKKTEKHQKNEVNDEEFN